MEGLRQRKKITEKKDEGHQLMDHLHQVNMILLHVIIIVNYFILRKKSLWFNQYNDSLTSMVFAV